MQNPLDLFGAAVRAERVKKRITQCELADRLHRSVRTIIEIERCKSSPKFETVTLLAKELNISLDALVFQSTVTGTISKSVVDFFAGKSETDIQKYITLCQQAEAFKTEQ